MRANTQIVMGNLYTEILERGVKWLTCQTGQKIDIEKANRKTVDFPTLNLAWPVVKEFENRADAIRYFKLANT